MVRKTVLNSAAAAAILASVAVAMPAFAGGYGYSSHGPKTGGAKPAVRRPFGHIRDRIWQQHAAWCENRFKSYNPYDNTYQPYSGPREQCWSPHISR
ncbi:MAG: hypothetical protein Tsb0019_29260 [Roseibium sp.]